MIGTPTYVPAAAWEGWVDEPALHSNGTPPRKAFVGGTEGKYSRESPPHPPSRWITTADQRAEAPVPILRYEAPMDASPPHTPAAYRPFSPADDSWPMYHPAYPAVPWVDDGPLEYPDNNHRQLPPRSPYEGRGYPLGPPEAPFLVAGSHRTPSHHHHHHHHHHHQNEQFQYHHQQTEQKQHDHHHHHDPADHQHDPADHQRGHLDHHNGHTNHHQAPTDHQHGHTDHHNGHADHHNDHGDHQHDHGDHRQNRPVPLPPSVLRPQDDLPPPLREDSPRAPARPAADPRSTIPTPAPPPSPVPLSIVPSVPIAAAATTEALGTPAAPLPPGQTQPPGPVPEADDTFFVGELIIMIHHAEQVPNLDAVFLGHEPNSNPIGRLRGKIKRPDFYVRLVVDGKKGSRTRTIKNSLHPKWEQYLIVHLVGEVKSLVLQVKDEEAGGWIRGIEAGETKLHIPDYIHGDKSRVILPRINPNGQKGSGGQLCISTWYLNNARYHGLECPYQIFPLRKRCTLALYADSHTSPSNPVPPVPTDRGEYRGKDLWTDIHRTLMNAKKVIYICGWSVWVHLRLIRPPHGELSETLGEILKRKAAEGVIVRVMVWNDVSSVDNRVVNKVFKVTEHGLMGTHDEETNRYFRHTDVLCVRVHNNELGYKLTGGNQGNVNLTTSFGARLGKNISWTHHQKIVCCDEEGWGGSGTARKIVAYVGGIDLTTGRYDDSEHPLFSTLDTTHKDDWYQNCVLECHSDVGPREPWHDLHAKVQGPVARDVAKNFEDRWMKQAVPQFRMGKKRMTKKPTLFNFNNPDILRPQDDIAPAQESWSIQMFRSIGEESAINVHEVEIGIQNAYIFAIRRAQKFIYVENQYFMGGATEWERFDDKNYNVECKNRIPIELAMRIVTKIRQGLPFKVYVTVPMYSEGEAGTGTLQAILFWQAETVRMMYKKIADAIKRWGPPDAHPRDYLKFFFPAKREPEADPPNPTTHAIGERNRLLTRTKRHMIYVHSKMAIFDDEYVIIGSANINQRSMDGARDTEIAVGAVEDGFVLDRDGGSGGSLPRGQVSGYRLNLWSEHLGSYRPEFRDPHTEQCAALVDKMALENWTAFSGDEVRSLPYGHLCRYPYDVDLYGKVTPTTQFFPDHEMVNAHVMGTQPPIIMQLMTT